MINKNITLLKDVVEFLPPTLKTNAQQYLNDLEDNFNNLIKELDATYQNCVYPYVPAEMMSIYNYRPRPDAQRICHLNIDDRFILLGREQIVLHVDETHIYFTAYKDGMPKSYEKTYVGDGQRKPGNYARYIRVNYKPNASSRYDSVGKKSQQIIQIL
jgi:hypothetical protein